MDPLVIAEQVPTHLPLMLVIGFAIFAGTIGGRIFQRLHIPQVVGYIAVGLLLGKSGASVTGFELIDDQALTNLEPFNFFALGLIGFMIGGELRREVFAKQGRQLLAVLVGEGLGSFVLVSMVVGGITWAFTSDPTKAIALGLLFGSISSATAPAATVNVLWEYKTRGPLTTTIFAMVALDDALALGLYAVASSIALVLLGNSDSGLLSMLGRAGWELGGAIVLGGLAGLGLNIILRTARDYEKAVPMIIGSLALVIGACITLHFDLILAPMVLGLTLVNLAPRRSQAAFRIVEQFAAPLYVLFFVFVGAHLEFAGMAPWMWALAGGYVLARSTGKIVGANLSARMAGSPAVIRKYLGLALFCQGGVAVGLSILAGSRFPGEIGTTVITIIAATTVIVELIGPPCVKMAVKLAGEVGLNVTEDDLMDEYKVTDMMEHSAPQFKEDTVLKEILRTISVTEAMCYPVVDAQGRLTGVITMQDLKQSFGGDGLGDWLVALDIMQPAPATITQQSSLSEAMTRMRESDLEYLPVLARDDDDRLVGLLELRAVNRKLSQEVLRRQQLANAPAA